MENKVCSRSADTRKTLAVCNTQLPHTCGKDQLRHKHENLIRITRIDRFIYCMTIPIPIEHGEITNSHSIIIFILLLYFGWLNNATRLVLNTTECGGLKFEIQSNKY